MAHPLCHPLEWEDRRNVLQPGREVAVNEEDPGDELQDQHRRRDHCRRARPDFGTDEYAIPRTVPPPSEHEDPREREPARRFGGQLHPVDQRGVGKQQNRLRHRRDEDHADLAQVGDRQLGVPAAA